MAAWHKSYCECMQYFINEGQRLQEVRILANFINIRLPFQRNQRHLQPSQLNEAGSSYERETLPYSQDLFVSPIPYIRRLVATGSDEPAVFDKWFGSAWSVGIGMLVHHERRNFCFAARSGNWLAMKQAYDMPPDEQIPWIRPSLPSDEFSEKQYDDIWMQFEAVRDYRSPSYKHRPPIADMAPHWPGSAPYHRPYPTPRYSHQNQPEFQQGYDHRAPSQSLPRRQSKAHSNTDEEYREDVRLKSATEGDVSQEKGKGKRPHSFGPSDDEDEGTGYFDVDKGKRRRRGSFGQEPSEIKSDKKGKLPEREQ